MQDFTKEFIKVCDAKRDIYVFSGCTDGSEDCAKYTYENRLANFKHLIEGKDWELSYGNLTFKGNSYTSLLDEEIKDYDYRADYKFEVES